MVLRRQLQQQWVRSLATVRDRHITTCKLTSIIDWKLEKPANWSFKFLLLIHKQHVTKLVCDLYLSIMTVFNGDEMKDGRHQSNWGNYLSHKLSTCSSNQHYMKNLYIKYIEFSRHTQLERVPVYNYLYISHKLFILEKSSLRTFIQAKAFSHKYYS